MRVAQQTTLLDGKNLNSLNTLVWEVAGTGSGTFTNNKYNMAVTSGQWLILQTRRRYPYFSGKSQRVEETVDGFQPETNVTKRYGYFSSNAASPYDSDYDGMWIESANGTITLNVARSGTKTLDALPITSWRNYALLGEYQNVANWANFTVAEMKFLWLGGAVFALSIQTQNGFIEAHRFVYAGTSQDIFTSSPSQPARLEIRSSTGSGSLRYVCSQIATEGSVDESGEGLGLFNASAINANVVGTLYALIGIKKQTAYRDNAVQIVDLGVSTSAITSDTGIIMLIINPTLSASLTYANLSRIQVAYATNQTITAGTGRVICAFPTTSSSGGVNALNKNFLSWLSSTINNTHDEYVLAYMPTSTNQSVFGIANIKEYS